MKRTILLVFLSGLWLAGCGGQTNVEENIDANDLPEGSSPELVDLITAAILKHSELVGEKNGGGGGSKPGQANFTRIYSTQLSLDDYCAAVQGELSQMDGFRPGENKMTEDRCESIWTADLDGSEWRVELEIKADDEGGNYSVSVKTVEQ